MTSWYLHEISICWKFFVALLRAILLLAHSKTAPAASALQVLRRPRQQFSCRVRKAEALGCGGLMIQAAKMGEKIWWNMMKPTKLWNIGNLRIFNDVYVKIKEEVQELDCWSTKQNIGTAKGQIRIPTPVGQIQMDQDFTWVGWIMWLVQGCSRGKLQETRVFFRSQMQIYPAGGSTSSTQPEVTQNSGADFGMFFRRPLSVELQEMYIYIYMYIYIIMIQMSVSEK